MKRMLIAIVFSFLLFVNLFLWIRYRAIVAKRIGLEAHVQLQMETLQQQDSEAFKELVAQISSRERDEKYWIEQHLTSVRETEDFLVQSGPSVVSQVIRSKRSGRDAAEVRLLLYLPLGPNRVRYAFNSTWMSELEDTSVPPVLLAGNPRSWEEQHELDLEPGKVHEIVFAVQRGAEGSFLSVRAGEQYDRKFPLRPFRNPGQSYGADFAMFHPNAIPGKHYNAYSTFKFHNELFEHYFSLKEDASPKKNSSVAIRAWVHSDDTPSVPIGNALSDLQKIIKSYWFDDVHNVPQKFSDQFENYDGSGRLFIKSKYP